MSDTNNDIRSTTGDTTGVSNETIILQIAYTDSYPCHLLKGILFAVLIGLLEISLEILLLKLFWSYTQKKKSPKRATQKLYL